MRGPAVQKRHSLLFCSLDYSARTTSSSLLYCRHHLPYKASEVAVRLGRIFAARRNVLLVGSTGVSEGCMAEILSGFIRATPYILEKLELILFGVKGEHTFRESNA